VENPADGKSELASELARKDDVAKAKKASLVYVRGRPWSPGVYKSLRLLGRPVEVAWRRAFIPLSTF
jgi:hypothetical protein